MLERFLEKEAEKKLAKVPKKLRSFLVLVLIFLSIFFLPSIAKYLQISVTKSENGNVEQTVIASFAPVYQTVNNLDATYEWVNKNNWNSQASTETLIIDGKRENVDVFTTELIFKLSGTGRPPSQACLNGNVYAEESGFRILSKNFNKKRGDGVVYSGCLQSPGDIVTVYVITTLKPSGFDVSLSDKRI